MGEEGCLFNLVALRKGATVGTRLVRTAGIISLVILTGLTSSRAAVAAVPSLPGGGAVDRILSGEQTAAPWHLDRIDQRDLLGDTMYRYPRSGSGFKAYVLSDGIRATHREFLNDSGVSRVVCGVDLATPPCRGLYRTSWGTSWADTIAGQVYGVAKNATIVDVRVTSSNILYANAATLRAGVQWVTANAHGDGVGFLPWGDLAAGPDATALAGDLRASIASGVTWVVGMGVPDPDDSCWSAVLTVPGIIAVGASTGDDYGAVDSPFGACQDFYAPGASVTSANASSDSAVSTSSYIADTPTSAAVVAGAALVMLEQYPTWLPGNVLSYLNQTSTRGRINAGDDVTPNRLVFVGNPWSCDAFSNTTNISIPVGGQGVSQINNSCNYAASGATIEVHLKNVFYEHATIDLIRPNGTAMRLDDITTGRWGNVDHVYSVTFGGARSGREGVYSLRVQISGYDYSPYIDSWTIDMF